MFTTSHKDGSSFRKCQVLHKENEKKILVSLWLQSEVTGIKSQCHTTGLYTSYVVDLVLAVGVTTMCTSEDGDSKYPVKNVREQDAQLRSYGDNQTSCTLTEVSIMKLHSHLFSSKWGRDLTCWCLVKSTGSSSLKTLPCSRSSGATENNFK